MYVRHCFSKQESKHIWLVTFCASGESTEVQSCDRPCANNPKREPGKMIQTATMKYGKRRQSDPEADFPEFIRPIRDSIETASRKAGIACPKKETCRDGCEGSGRISSLRLITLITWLLLIESQSVLRDVMRWNGIQTVDCRAKDGKEE